MIIYVVVILLQLTLEVFSSFLKSVVTVFERNSFPIRRFTCDVDESTSRQRNEAQKLLNDLTKAMEANNLIFLDQNSKIWQNLRFDVHTGVTDSTSSEITASVEMSGVKTFREVKKVRRFLRIGVTYSLPYTYYKIDPMTKEILRDANHRPIYEGFCIDLIKELARKMKFSYELVEPSSGKFGIRHKNGSFDGLVGDLVKGDTDLVIAALKMTAEREEYIDFVAPYFDQTGIAIVMKKPMPDTSLFKFMTVLRLEVWLSIFGALMATSLVIWILDIFSPYSSRNWTYVEPCR